MQVENSTVLTPKHNVNSCRCSAEYSLYVNRRFLGRVGAEDTDQCGHLCLTQRLRPIGDSGGSQRPPEQSVPLEWIRVGYWVTVSGPGASLAVPGNTGTPRGAEETDAQETRFVGDLCVIAFLSPAAGNVKSWLGFRK